MNPILVRRVIYPTYRMLRHDRVLANLAEMQRIDGLAPDEIRELQWGKLKTILEHASRNVPYYRRVFKSVGATAEDIRRPEDLSALPILRKQDIRENLQDLISETPHRTDLAPEETGGSTGQNLFFYVDRQALKARLANNARMNAWLGVRIGDRKASLWGMRFREHRLEKLKRTIKCWFDNTLYVSAYKMDPETIDRTAGKLGRFKPDMLIGFPSSLYHFAMAADAVAAAKIRPKVITTSGETLYDWQRSAIEAAFRSPVYNHYGCCEFGAIARECSERNGLHLAADRVYIESVPMTAQGSADSVCELVVSGLDNYGMPFIRYAIEDLGQVTWDRCSCGLGLPRLTSLAGRVYDIVQAPNGNFLGGTFWGHILKQGVEKFQVIQEELNEVKIIVVPTADFGDASKKYVLSKVREACGDQMRVVFDLKDDIDLTPSGKHRYVISRLLRRNDAIPKG